MQQNNNPIRQMMQETIQQKGAASPRQKSKGSPRLQNKINQFNQGIKSNIQETQKQSDFETQNYDQINNKVSQFQKTLLVRWLNTLYVWNEQLTTQNLIDEIKTGVLLCEIMNFHFPKLHITQGLNLQARVKKSCINNIEKALQIILQKGAPTRFIPTADEIFESEKNQARIWQMIKVLFDYFALQDAYRLSSQIFKWINMCVLFTGEQMQEKQKQINLIVSKMGHGVSQQHIFSQNMMDLYQNFYDGLIFLCIFKLFVPDPQQQPDSLHMFQHPNSKQEFAQNLHYINQITFKIGIPIYLQPVEFIDNFQPQFLVLQLYYLFLKFKDSNPNYLQPGSLGNMQFKDQGRKQVNDLEINKANQTNIAYQIQQQNNSQEQINQQPLSGNNIINGSVDQNMQNQSNQSNNSGIRQTQNSNSSGQAFSEPVQEHGNIGQAQESRDHTMGIIEEEDSMDFSSSVKSQIPANGYMNKDALSSYLQSLKTSKNPSLQIPAASYGNTPTTAANYLVNQNNPFNIFNINEPYIVQSEKLQSRNNILHPQTINEANQKQIGILTQAHNFQMKSPGVNVYNTMNLAQNPNMIQQQNNFEYMEKIKEQNEKQKQKYYSHIPKHNEEDIDDNSDLLMNRHLNGLEVNSNKTINSQNISNQTPQRDKLNKVAPNQIIEGLNKQIQQSLSFQMQLIQQKQIQSQMNNFSFSPHQQPNEINDQKNQFQHTNQSKLQNHKNLSQSKQIFDILLQNSWKSEQQQNIENIYINLKQNKDRFSLGQIENERDDQINKKRMFLEKMSMYSEDLLLNINQQLEQIQNDPSSNMKYQLQFFNNDEQPFQNYQIKDQNIGLFDNYSKTNSPQRTSDSTNKIYQNISGGPLTEGRKIQKENVFQNSKKYLIQLSKPRRIELLQKNQNQFESVTLQNIVHYLMLSPLNGLNGYQIIVKQVCLNPESFQEVLKFPIEIIQNVQILTESIVQIAYLIQGEQTQVLHFKIRDKNFKNSFQEIQEYVQMWQQFIQKM